MESVKNVWARIFVIGMTLVRLLASSWLSEVDGALAHLGPPAFTKVDTFQHDEPLDDEPERDRLSGPPPPPFEPMQHDAWPYWDDGFDDNWSVTAL